MVRQLIVVIGLIVSLVGGAAAKSDPYIEDPQADWGDLTQPQAVWSPDAAVVMGGRLGVFGDVDAFAYTFKQAEPGWSFDLIVPACGQHFLDVYPSAAVIGPGLKPPAEGTLPFDLPKDTGAVVFPAFKRDDGQRLVNEDNPIRLIGYQQDALRVDIPQAGQYVIAVWEPDGNVGAYALSTGVRHDNFAIRSEVERQAAFDLLFGGGWMRQDCNAPLATKTCPATEGSLGDSDLQTAPERATVGAGFTLTGYVRNSRTCLPVAKAQIVFWLVNEKGQYDDAHRGTLYSNAQGGYRILSNFPKQYGPPPHIHLQISAPGYQTLTTEYILSGKIERGEFAIGLTPGT
jgi:hypothetical protein